MALRERLRHATEDAHDALEASPWLEAITRGGPRHPLYVAWLRIMAVVVGTLEHQLGAADDPGLRSLWKEQTRRLPLLQSDLAALDEVAAQPTAAIEPMLALVQTLRQWGHDRPIRLAGVLYVVEGSTLGRRILHERFAAQRRPDAPGQLYVSAYSAGTRRSREDSCRGLDALSLSRSEAQQIVDAAQRFLEAMRRIVEALPPRGDQEHAAIQALNFDAGAHPVTQDPRELVAAIDAGQRTWDAYPYYAARYGQRGRRFTRSDSGWLVTLADDPEPSRLAQLDWLARLLAMRGMPSLLLEEHLRHLHQALVVAVPQRADRYGRLEAAARRFRDLRLAAVPDFDAIAAELSGHALPNIGPVLVGAVADERRGLSGALAEVKGWLTDPERFSAAWIAEIERVVGLLETNGARGG